MTFALQALEEGDAALDEDDYEASLSPVSQRQTARTGSAAPTPTPATTPPFLTVAASAP